mgnify:CR=1 FL=1
MSELHRKLNLWKSRLKSTSPIGRDVAKIHVKLYRGIIERRNTEEAARHSKTLGKIIDG